MSLGLIHVMLPKSTISLKTPSELDRWVFNWKLVHPSQISTCVTSREFFKGRREQIVEEILQLHETLFGFVLHWFKQLYHVSSSTIQIPNEVEINTGNTNKLFADNNMNYSLTHEVIFFITCPLCLWMPEAFKGIPFIRLILVTSSRCVGKKLVL